MRNSLSPEEEELRKVADKLLPSLLAEQLGPDFDNRDHTPLSVIIAEDIAAQIRARGYVHDPLSVEGIAAILRDYGVDK